MGRSKEQIFGLKSQLASVSAERNILHETLHRIQVSLYYNTIIIE